MKKVMKFIVLSATLLSLHAILSQSVAAHRTYNAESGPPYYLYYDEVDWNDLN
jgi:hypothetical protein